MHINILNRIIRYSKTHISLCVDKWCTALMMLDHFKYAQSYVYSLPIYKRNRDPAKNINFCCSVGTFVHISILNNRCKFKQVDCKCIQRSNNQEVIIIINIHITN